MKKKTKENNQMKVFAVYAANEDYYLIEKLFDSKEKAEAYIKDQEEQQLQKRQKEWDEYLADLDPEGLEAMIDFYGSKEEIMKSPQYGEFRCTVFARQWKLWKSIVDQGNEYVFVVNNKGILEELRKDN